MTLGLQKLIFLQEKFEDTQDVIRSLKSKKRQYNDHVKKGKMIKKNGPLSTMQKTEDWATQITLNTGVELEWSVMARQFLLH